MLRLLEASGMHWRWLCGEVRNSGDLVLPESGVDELPTLQKLRQVSDALRNAGCPHTYLIAIEKEVVGLCGYKHVPDPDKRVEIGFGVAAARRNRGVAGAAVGLLVDEATRDTNVRLVLAKTRVDNVASQSVLRRNGFAQGGNCLDDHEGEMIEWYRNLG